MVYIDEKGQRYEVQYCVILNKGFDRRLKHYFWASKEQIKNAMDEIRERSSFVNCKELCYNYKEGVYEGKVRFNPSRLGSLVIETNNLKSAEIIFLDLSEGPCDRV